MAAFGIVLAACASSGIYFETNDDRYITEILSGAMLGERDSHAVHINYLLSLPLSMLYGLTIEIPWYGGMLILFLGISYFAILCAVSWQCASVKQLPFVVAGAMAFFLLHYYVLGLLQFTSVAVMLALAAWICFLSGANGRWRYFAFAGLSLLSFLVRRDAMLLVMPMGMAVYGGFLVAEKGTTYLIKGKKLIIPVLILGTVMVVGFLGNAIGYSGSGWAEFQRYDKARAKISDYWGKPEYEEVEPILEKYAVTRAEYEAWCNYEALDWDISVDAIQEIEEYAKAKWETEGLSQFWSALWRQFWENDRWGINRVSMIMCVVCLAFLLFTRRFRLLVPLGGLQAAKLLVWGYLFYMGRMPHRVVIPLFACETAFLWMLMLKAAPLKESERGKEKQWQIWLGRSVILLVLCLFGAGAYFSGRQQYRYITEQNTGQRIFMEGMREIGEYCLKRPDHKYFLESVAMSYYKGSALETEIYGERNYMIMGTWYSNSPPMGKALREYLSDNENGIYLIVYDDATGKEHSSVKYLEEKTASEPVCVDSFTVSHGGTYLVYYFDGRLSLNGI